VKVKRREGSRRCVILPYVGVSSTLQISCKSSLG